MPANASKQPAPPGPVSFRISAGGNRLGDEWLVLSISVTKEINRIGEAIIVLHDGETAKEDFERSNKNELLIGQEIEIQVGYQSNDKPIFKGVIVQHGIKIIPDEGNCLIITARSKAFVLATHRSNAIFTDKKDNEIIEELAQKAGLQAAVKTCKIKHRQMIQFNASDWDFINLRAEQNAMYVLADDARLIVEPPDTRQQPALELQFGKNILEMEAEMDGRYSFENIEAAAWVPADQKMAVAEPAAPAAKEPGNFASSDAAAKLKNKKYALVHGGISPGNEMTAAADAIALRSQLTKIKGYVKCTGFAAIKPGQLVGLSKTGNRFSGNAFVSAVRQDIADGLWTTTLQLGYPATCYAERYTDINAPRAAGMLPAVNGLLTGIVSKIHEDPGNEFRVLVKIPAASEKEDAVWARVATLDAGKERGSFFRPEPGDEVILGFLNDDPRSAIILGGVHSSKLPPPLQPEEKNNEKGIVTREKMKLVFNEEKKSITIETPKGNKIILSEDEKGITVEDQNKNKITLNDKGIEINSAKDLILKADKGKISITAGKDIEIKSSGGKLQADGATGVKINSNAVTEVKGSLIKLN